MSCGLTIETENIERIFLGLALEAHQQIPSNLKRKKKKVIVLAGPTGCGKSDLAMQLCEQIPGEIVSADSIQVYKGMDIGTAKPSVEDRQQVAHHLVDIRNVKEPFNVVDFYYEARHTCQNILNRDRIPIIVGGSGFYIHSLLYGPPSGPPSVPELRKALEMEMEKLGPDEMFERLSQLDIDYARTITKNDKQKIIRALEIMTLTNKKVSKLSWKGRHKPLNYDFRCWFMHRPRETLYKRIESRCDKMMDQGFLQEVERMIEEGIRSNSSASQAIGYRQALEYLTTAKTQEDYKKFIDSFKQSSRHYAKRQLTWFRNEEPLFRWIDLDMHDQEVVVDIITQDYEQSL